MLHAVCFQSEKQNVYEVDDTKYNEVDDSLITIYCMEISIMVGRRQEYDNFIAKVLKGE